VVDFQSLGFHGAAAQGNWTPPEIGFAKINVKKSFPSAISNPPDAYSAHKKQR